MGSNVLMAQRHAFGGVLRMRRAYAQTHALHLFISLTSPHSVACDPVEDPLLQGAPSPNIRSTISLSTHIARFFHLLILSQI